MTDHAPKSLDELAADMTDHAPKSLDALAAEVLPLLKGHFLKRLAIDIPTAWDLTHDTWLRASKVLLHPATPFSSCQGQYKCIWIAAFWVRQDFIRKTSYRRPQEVSLQTSPEPMIEPSGIESIEDAVTINAILAVVMKMPSRDQLIFLGRYQKNLSYREIGNQVNLSEDSVRYHLVIIEEKIRHRIFTIEDMDTIKAKKHSR